MFAFYSGSPKLISDARIFDAVDLLVSMQCSDGGFGSYEVTRAPPFLESLNSAEVFGTLVRIVARQLPRITTGNTMAEHTYPECTTSVITALRIFQQYYPAHRKKDIEYVYSQSHSDFSSNCRCTFPSRTIAKAIKYLRREQRADGSWYGSWGICFTYATMFALESLALAGESYTNSARVKRACEFLLSKQMPDGGWGESYKVCP
jgi:lanosterol synthase